MWYNKIMRRFLVKVQFNGKQYAGFQINGEKKTIQLEIENCLQKLFGEKITIAGCSRTDSGVSAKEFYFTFDAGTKLPADRICFKLNRFLPNEIQCQQSSEVDTKFNLRANVESKTYEYSVYDGMHIQPLLNRDAVFVEGKLDVLNMQKCANMLVGKHNFKSFCNYNDDVKTYTRNLIDAKVVRFGDLIKIYLTADGFLYNMVRVVAGTLVECGKGNLGTKDIENLLKICDRSQNIAKTMSPKGLVLEKVCFKKWLRL